MAARRLLNPDADHLARVVAATVAEAQARQQLGRLAESPDQIHARIGELAEGVIQLVGPSPGNVPRSYGEDGRLAHLLAVVGTASGGDRFVLLDGRRVDPDSVPVNLPGRPIDLIRGWRVDASGEPVAAFDAPLADLARLPDPDPDREGLVLAAAFGDPLARAALRDFDEEHGVAPAARSSFPPQPNPLFAAIGQGNAELVSAVLTADPALIATRDEEGETPLCRAVRQLNAAAAIVSVLLAAGADPNARGFYFTPIHHCSQEVADLLLAAGAAINDPGRSSPLHWAAGWADLDHVRFLLDRGADIAAVDERGRTALHAAFDDDFPRDNARWLWDNGAPRDVFAAALLGELAWLRTALDANPRLVDAVDGYGQTPLRFAIRAGQRGAIDLLLDRGAGLDRPDRAGVTPRPRMLERGIVTPRTLEHRGRGFDINVPLPNNGVNGRTALHSAAQWGRLDRVRLLLQLGARLDVRDADGRTPHDYARAAGHHEVARLLWFYRAATV